MRYDGDSITFDVPDGWEDKSVVAFAAKESKPGRITANLALTREPLPPGDTLRRYADRQLVDIGRQLRDLELQGSGPMEVDGCEAFELRCSWRSATGAVEQRLIMIALDESVATLAITGPGGRREEIDAVATRVLSSLRLKGGTPKIRAEGGDPSQPLLRAARPVPHAPPSGSLIFVGPEGTIAPPPLFGQVGAPPQAPGREPSAAFAPLGAAERSGLRAARTAADTRQAPAPRAHDTELEAATLAATRWECEPAQVRLHDLALRFPWVVRHRMALATGPAGQWLVLASGVGQPLVFDPHRRVAELNQLLRIENLRLPGSFPAGVLADIVTLLLGGPAGAVGSPAFLQQQTPYLDQWLLPPFEEAERLFRRHCEAPTITRIDGGQWMLELSYFAERGVVERWLVTGDERRIQRADVQVVVKEARLRFPRAK